MTSVFADTHAAVLLSMTGDFLLFTCITNRNLLTFHGYLSDNMKCVLVVQGFNACTHNV